MKRSALRLLLIGILVAPGLLAGPRAASAQGPSLEEVLAGYAEARGAEAWSRAETLVLTGTYAAFSQRSDFTLLRRRGEEHDLYRLDFTLLGDPAIRARGAEGPWWRHPLIQPEPARLTEGPYREEMERESWFAPALLEAGARGVEVELLGSGEIDGVETVDLRLVFPGGVEEVWHLDAETLLEFAVDSQVVDWTQGTEPMARRAFFDDFREVDGLVLPFRVEVEFGARLETMEVASAVVNGAIDPSRLVAPPPAPPAPEEEAETASEEGA